MIIYHPVMMRFLLTLLALLSGLVAQTSPAFARVTASSEAEIGVVQTAQASARAATQLQLVHAPVTAQLWLERVTTRVFGLSLAIFIPTVLIGVDRSRE